MKLGAAVVFLAATGFADERAAPVAGDARPTDPLDDNAPDPSLVLKPPMKSDSVYDEIPRETEQVLGGHLFIFPILHEPAFMTTHVSFTQALEMLDVPDAPVRQGRTYDVKALGVDESIFFGARFLDRFEASIGGAAEAYSGTGIKSALIGGAAYWFDGQLGLGMRLWRGRRTEFSVRLNGAFGSAKRVEFLPVLTALATQTQPVSVDAVVDGSSGRKVVTPASRDAVKLSFHAAHALSRAFGLQGAFSVNESFMSLRVTYDDQRHIDATITTPEIDAAVTWDLRPLVPHFPMELIGEYSVSFPYVASKEPGISKWLETQQEIAGGAYYSGRRDLQIGLNVRHILTFETTQGFGNGARPYPTGSPTFTALELTLRYIW